MTAVHISNLDIWLKLTKPGKEGNNEVIVGELTKEIREEGDEKQRRHEQVLFEKWRPSGHNGSALEAFDRLWPFQKSGKDWREIGRSWLLQRNM
jgi:hypothetical protein